MNFLMMLCGQDDGGRTALAIPNREIQWIFREQIQECFETESKRDMQNLERLVASAFSMNFLMMLLLLVFTQ